MKLHVLPGDAYVDTFHETGIEGDLAIFRECFVEGDLQGDSLNALWQTREKYLSAAYPDPDKSYKNSVVSEIDKLAAPVAGDEINLWFEYELFCSANLWFCLYLLQDSKAALYRVAPTVRDDKTRWRGFGKLSAEEMQRCFDHRVQFTDKDIKHGADLWLAFRSANDERLITLGTYESPAFPYLEEVCQAAIEKNTKPKQIINEIVREGSNDFKDVFTKFSQRAGVFGLGDVQVQRIMEGN